MNTAGTIIGADATGNAIAFMIDKYLVQGAEVTSDTLIECMEIAAGGLQTSTSAKGLSDSLPKSEIDEYLRELFEYFMADNSGKVSFGNESGSNIKTLFRGDKASVVPNDVFQNGFKPKGTHNDALLHTKSNTTAGNFVSISSDKIIATEFAEKMAMYM